MARVVSALRRFENSLAGDALGVLCLCAMLVMALYAPLIWGAP